MNRLIDFEDGLSLGTRHHGLDLPENGLLLSRGRDALTIICGQLKRQFNNPKVFLPAFICDVVPDTFIKNNVGVSFYDITDKLEVDLNSLNKLFTKDISAILYVNYFGFLQPSEKITALADYGLPLIEDNSHGFLSGSVLANTRNVTGWSFNSFRKLLPVPDGSMLIVVGESQSVNLKLHRPAFNYITSRFLGLLFKKIALKFPQYYLDSIRQELFTFSVRTVNYTGPARMALVSKYLLNHIDFEQVKVNRRRNYATLSEGIMGSRACQTIYDQLPDDICPFGLPVIVKSRNKLQNRLVHQKISSAILWDKNNLVSRSDYPVSTNISDHILVLPVGQKYSPDDMLRIKRTIREVL